MSIELLKSISTQKAHKTCYKQGSILHYLGTNQIPRLTFRFYYLYDLCTCNVIDLTLILNQEH